MTYTPPPSILKKYADVLINYGLHNGAGVKKGDVVLLQVPECAKPLLIELYRTVLSAGAHPIIQFVPDDMGRIIFEHGSHEQLTFFPKHLLRGRLKEADHLLFIIADTDKHELEGVSPEKIMLRNQSFKQYMQWRTEKENRGALSMTLAMYGTQAMADEVGLSLEAYWNEIIKACYLRDKDPVKTWKGIQRDVQRLQKKLDALKIQELHIQAKSTDLTVRLGPGRRWLGATGNNIPSFEVFISPDWRGTQGHIQFTEPLYRYGTLIENAYLEFRDGVVVHATAEKGEDVLRAMIAVKGADRIGEFSLTDGRLSKITRFMGETLFDENVGGRYGNTHIALGNAYQDSYPGDPSSVSKAMWKRMGYNESVVHTDIVSTSDRVVTATLPDGKQKIIYEHGRFTL